MARDTDNADRKKEKGEKRLGAFELASCFSDPRYLWTSVEFFFFSAKFSVRLKS